MSDQHDLTEFLQSRKQEKRDGTSEDTDAFGWGSFGKPPEDWSVSRIKDLFEIKKDSADPDELDTDEFVRLFSMPAYDDGATPKLVKPKDIGSKKFVVPDESLLFSKLNISKKRFWLVNHSYEEPALCSTEYWPILPNEKVNLGFYLQYFNSDSFIDRPRLSTSSTTNSHQRIKSNLFNKVKLPVPPLSEQRKIATVLHTIDQAIQKTEKIIRQFEQIHQGLFQSLIPRGIGHDEYDDVRILGRTVQIPTSWEITTVSQACSNIIDYRGKNPEFSGEGIPHLRNINISRGKITLDDIKYVSQETYDEWMTRGVPEKGDTLLSTEAPMGKTALLPNLKFSLSQRLIVLSPSNQFDSRFFAHLMGSPFIQKEYDARATGSTVKGISNYNLQEVTIPVPPKKEQEQIAQYINDTLKVIQKNEQQVRRLQRLKQGLMQDLLSGEVRTIDANIDIAEEVKKHG